MAADEHIFRIPDEWTSSVNKLAAERNMLAGYVGDMAAMFRQQAEISQLSHMTAAMKLYDSEVADITTPLNNLTAAINSPSLLINDQQKSHYLSSDLVIGPTGAILDSASSMAANICSSTKGLLNLYVSELKALNENANGSLQLLGKHFSELKQDTLGEFGNKIQSNLLTFNSLIETSLVTSKINAEIFARPVDAINTYLVGTSNSFKEMNLLSSQVYSDIANSQSIFADSFLFKAPTVEPYSAMRASSVLAGFDDDSLERLSYESSDALLDELGDELELRLQKVNPELVEVYREGLSAIKSGHHGWIRHAGVSFRTLFEHLLRELAPDSDLSGFLEDAEKCKINGEFSRSSRLNYIFRKIASGSYSKMAEQDIKLAEATFFPSNDIVHSLSSPLSEKQMRVFCRRIQGSISVVLEAAGY